MQWHKFIFSNQSRQRMKRHFLFWLLWLMYIVFNIFFYAQKTSAPYFYQNQPGLNDLGYLQNVLLVLIKSLLLLVAHLFFCYVVIYFFIPNYLLKKKYLHFLTGILLLCSISIPLGYILYSLVYPFVDSLFQHHATTIYQNIFWTSVIADLMGSIRVTLIAVAIILLKRWWVKQKEKEKLEREKVNAELQLLKAQIQPVFLFRTLTNIIQHARLASSKASEMLIKLSDLLSYMLYECDVPQVGVEKEITMVKDYMELEKTRQGGRLEMTVQIKGNISRQMISPLILFPFIDNSLSYCNEKNLEKSWINLEIIIDGNNLYMKLINGLPIGINGKPTIDEQLLINVQKRLQLFYPGKHELKISAEQELLMVYLNLKLEVATQIKQTNIETTKNVLNYA